MSNDALIKHHFEAVDEFFNVNHGDEYDQYICTQDMDKFHSHSNWSECMGYTIEKDAQVKAWFTCEDCNQKFFVTYKYAFTETYEERDAM